LFDLDGNLVASFAHRPEPLSITEGAFHQVSFTTNADSVVVWGLIGRSSLYWSYLGSEAIGVVSISEVPEPDWEHAPRTPDEIIAWTAEHLRWLMAVLPCGRGYVARFQGGDVQRGLEWQQYVVLDEHLAERVVTGRTSVALVGANHAGRVLGIEIDEQGDAYLGTYLVNGPCTARTAAPSP
jgi:hypothetical protein